MVCLCVADNVVVKQSMLYLFLNFPFPIFFLPLSGFCFNLKKGLDNGNTL